MNEAESLAYVERAIADMPSVLAQTLEAALPHHVLPPNSVVTTGIGASEGPARMLAALLVESGVAARFCPLSSFARGAAPRGELLVLFSQGLSPNARLVLTDAEHFTQRWLVTAIDPRRSDAAARAKIAPFLAQGFSAVTTPPSAESGTLVRIIGPTIATLMALRLAALLLGDERLANCAREAPSAYRCPKDSAPLPDGPLAIVTIHTALEAAQQHRWKLLEALLRCDPPIYDALQFAHGPLQATHERELTFLVLERGQGSPLRERFEHIVVPGRHRLLHLPTEHDDALSYFEHAAALDALIAATLRASPRDLFNWPAKNADGPLYGFPDPLR